MYRYFTYHYRLINKNTAINDKLSDAEKLAESVCFHLSKWGIIIFQIGFVAVWTLWNSLKITVIYDPFPFPLLWLILFTEILVLLLFHMMNITALRKRLIVSNDHDFYIQSKHEHEHKQFQDHLNNIETLILRILEFENERKVGILPEKIYVKDFSNYDKKQSNYE